MADKPPQTREGDAHSIGGIGAPLAARFSYARRVRIAARLLPFVMWHFLGRPYRLSRSAKQATRHLNDPESRRLAHDIYCTMLLRGYRRLTGYPVNGATGLVAVLFAIFIYTFDQQFERQRRNGTLSGYEAIIYSPPVSAIWTALAGYLRAYGRDEAVLEHVCSTFAAYYDSYCAQVGQAVTYPDYRVAVKLVEHDSGLAMQTMYHVIRLFNDHPFHSECARQFFALGMAGKYIDDIADVADDCAAGNPNLMHALVSGNKGEERIVGSAIEAGERLTLSWWSRHCPVSFNAYLRDAFRYYDQISDRILCLPVDVYILILHSSRFWRAQRRRSPLEQA